MQSIIEKKTFTESEIFLRGIEGVYTSLLSQHNNLMKVWSKDDAKEILKGLGPKAFTIFTASSLIQQILKISDSSYNVIMPYRLVDVEEPALDDEGNQVMKKEYEIVIDEETGFQKLDENNRIVTVEVQTPVVRTVKKKELLTPQFNQDGSLDDLIPTGIFE